MSDLFDGRRALLRAAAAVAAQNQARSDGLRRPMNAPPAADLTPGVTAGAQSPVVRANLVIVSGPTGAIVGVFVYTPGTTPGPGNPPIFWATSGTHDPFGNTLPSTTGVAGTGTFQAGNTITTTSGTFKYSGTPAAGNLIMSEAQANGIDLFGNHYINGFWSYAAAVAVGTTGTTTAFDVATGSLAAGWSIATLLSSDGTNTSLVAATSVKLQIGPGVATLTESSNGVITVAYISGLSGQLPTVAVDTTTHAVGNVATAGDITASWSIPAADGVAGTTYVIKGYATLSSGATAAETLTIGVDINNGISGGGTLTPLATLGAAFNGSALSTGYDLPFELTLVVDSNGLNTPQIVLNADIADTAASRLSTNSATMGGHTNTATWNKGNLNTLAVYAVWGGAGGAGQNIQATWSKLYREGP